MAEGVKSNVAFLFTPATTRPNGSVVPRPRGVELPLLRTKAETPVLRGFAPVKMARANPPGHIPESRRPRILWGVAFLTVCYQILYK